MVTACECSETFQPAMVPSAVANRNAAGEPSGSMKALVVRKAL